MVGDQLPDHFERRSWFGFAQRIRATNVAPSAHGLARALTSNTPFRATKLTGYEGGIQGSSREQERAVLKEGTPNKMNHRFVVFHRSVHLVVLKF